LVFRLTLTPFLSVYLPVRACAAAALKDLAAYFTQEQGQVAVSRRTNRAVQLMQIK
jgi:hypothetical protein